MTDPHADLELIDLETDAPREPDRAKRRMARPEGASGAAPGRDRRSLAIAVLVLALLVGLWVLLAYRELTAVRSDLLEASSDLQQAVAAVGDGDLAQAEGRLQSSRSTLSDVPSRIGSVKVAPARLLPGLRRTLTAVGDLSRAAEMVAAAGLDVTTAFGGEEGDLGALAPTGGRIPVDTFAGLAPVFTQAHTAIEDAVSLVSDIPRTGIHSDVRDARDTFLAQVEPAVAQMQVASDLTAVVPALFGAESPRRYMVVASNPTEARGSGGFYGAYSILEADDGQLTFTSVEPTQSLPELPRGIIPWPDPSLEERYDAYGGTGFIVNLNMTPDFPSAATALERFHEEATGIPLDGVIAVDPFAFESLLRIAGPVEVPGYGTVGPDEVVEFVSHDAYAVILDPEERKRLIGLVATVALQGFLDSPEGVDAADVVSVLGEMVARESLLVHAADPDEQGLLADLGLSGRLGVEEPADFLGVFLNSGASYKVDYWLERHLRYDVVLGPAGVAAATLSTGFINGAPTEGEPPYMIGFGFDPLDVGDVLAFVSVYCAPGCRQHEVPDSGFDDLVTERGVELGYGVTSTWMRLPAQQAQELIWSYTTPGAWQQRGLDRVYRLHYDHQTSIIPIQLDVRVAIPDGHEPTAVPDDARVEDGAVVLQAAATTDLDVEIVFSPSR